jgi:hypothetical protein
MTAARLLASEGTPPELPVEPWVMGAGAFVLLVVMLLITLAFGKDR